MVLSMPRKDITKLLISTPSHFIGHYEHDAFRVVVVNQNLGVKSARKDERNYKQYIEVTVETPEYQNDTVVISDYSQFRVFTLTNCCPIISFIEQIAIQVVQNSPKI